MPKGYLFAQTEAFDQAEIQKYRDTVAPTVAAYGGRFLVRGGDPEIIEGEPKAAFKTAIIEFPSRERLMEWYNSPEYQEVLQYRLRASHSTVWVMTGYE